MTFVDQQDKLTVLEIGDNMVLLAHKLENVVHCNLPWPKLLKMK